MNNKDLIKKYKDLKAPQVLRKKIMTDISEAPAATENPVLIKRNNFKKITTVIFAAAIMLSLVIAVTAVVLSGQNMFLFPSLGGGLFNSGDIIYMPEVVELRDNMVIESIIVYEENGENIFNMMVSHSGNFKGSGHGFKLPEENYKNIEIMFNDGTSVILDGLVSIGGGGGDGVNYDYFYQCVYEYANFPNETKFTVKNNALGLSADINLSKSSNELSVTDNGIKRVNVFSADGSAILSYNVEMLRPTLLESDNRFYDSVLYGISGDITYQNGNTTMFGTYLSSGGSYQELTEYIDYPRYKFGEARINNAEREKFNKITINQIQVTLSTDIIEDTGMPDPKDRLIIATMPEFIYTVPLPELNGRIEFETPYYLDTIGEFEIYFKAIEYKNGKLFIEVAEDGIKYNGFEDISRISLGFHGVNDSNRTSGASGIDDYFYRYEMLIGYPGSDTVDIALNQLSYTINGLWEINFN